MYHTYPALSKFNIDKTQNAKIFFATERIEQFDLWHFQFST